MTEQPEPTPATRVNRWLILAALCLAVFLISTSTTVMNVTLPTLVVELGAGTRDLQWIVDAFNLSFAALVLAAGSLSDRFGRRRALVAGLVVFGAAAVAGAWSETPATLTAWRGLMGVGAAIIFPTTLSIIANVFPDRNARAQAIGIWGATTGIAVAMGPIGGGFLLEHFWWGSTMFALGPLALAAIGAAVLVVPDSRDPAAPRLDWRGLVTSTGMLAALVYTIIEAPEAGWGSAATLLGFAVVALLTALFVAAERSVAQPMLDVRLFANPRFSAASGSVTLAFFCLFGFIFLMTQYFQFLKLYSPLDTGVRLLPVAGSLAVASIGGIRLAVAVGTKAVVAAGLGLLTLAYLWISRVDADTPYPVLAGQMVLLGLGMGLTTAPATEAIMGVVPKDKAGIGSAVNDATRELGGTLGVAVFGSVFASVYRDRLSASVFGDAFPRETLGQAQESIGAALIAAERIAAAGQPAAADRLANLARGGFLDGLSSSSLVAAAVALAGALFALVLLPAYPASELESASLPGQGGEGKAKETHRRLAPGSAPRERAA